MGARRKTPNLQIKNLLQQQSEALSQKKVPRRDKLNFFSRDRAYLYLFCTSLCACRCLRASGRGRDRGHGPSGGRARSARADRSSSHHSSGPLHSVEPPRPRLHKADVSSSLGASNNDPPPDTSSLQPMRTRLHFPDGGMAAERRPLAARAVRRSEFRWKPG